jgi:hypothetical protein
MIMIIKVCVLKSLSGALLKGGGGWSRRIPRRARAKLPACADSPDYWFALTSRGGVPPSVGFKPHQTPPYPMFLLLQITYLLADNMRNYSFDLIVQMSVTTPRPLLRFQVEIRGSSVSNRQGRICSCQGHRDNENVEASIRLLFLLLLLLFLITTRNIS